MPPWSSGGRPDSYQARTPQAEKQKGCHAKHVRFIQYISGI